MLFIMVHALNKKQDPYSKYHVKFQTSRCSTALPLATTTPAPSWPGMSGILLLTGQSPSFGVQAHSTKRLV